MAIQDLLSSRLTTDNVHADRLFGTDHGALHHAIQPSVQYGFERVEDLIGVFQGTVNGGYNYARQGTPTTAALEYKITQLEQGLGSIVFATGMAAISALFFSLLRQGDHIVVSRYLFGNTNSLLGTLEQLGVAVTRVDATAAEHVAAAAQANTRMVFVETIANPGTQVADLAGIGRVCAERGWLYVVDNTVTSPALFQPRTVGAGLVIHSLTKTIAGHGAALGGSITDTGLFDWRSWPNLADGYRQGDPRQWGLKQLRKKGLRDMGGTLASAQAHSISMGAETLALRVRQSTDTALRLATWLQQHPAVASVWYPGLASHPQHARAQQLFAGASWLLSFELVDADRLLPVINALKLVVKATGLGDTRSLIIPVAPTIFHEAGIEGRTALGIPEGLIRVSIGLEAADDLIADFDQALKA